MHLCAKMCDNLKKNKKNKAIALQRKKQARASLKPHPLLQGCHFTAINMSAVLLRMLRDAHIPALPSSAAVLLAGSTGGRRYQPTRPPGLAARSWAVSRGHVFACSCNSCESFALKCRNNAKSTIFYCLTKVLTKKKNNNKIPGLF